MPATLAGFERLAATRLAAGPYGYYAGGAGDELTRRDNEAAWNRIALLPRVLVDVSRVDTGVNLLGETLPHPLVIAPMAYLKHADPDGALAAARAAEGAGATFCLSTFAHTRVAELAAAQPGCRRWFQLYVLRDRGESADLVAAAADSGYGAVVVTVDRPVLGARGGELGSDLSFVSPPGEPVATVSELAGRHVSAIDPSVTWLDIERLVATSPVPVVLKGILSPDDARRAVAAGAAAVVVSNHGGRQLDTVLSGADALGPVVDAVAGKIDILVDGGIRRGTDIVKALAIGANAVLIGRPVLWGLGAAGEAGARAVLEILLTELRTALALVGVPVAADLHRGYVQPAPWAATLPIR